MKHKLNSKGQAGTIADACKIAENLVSSQPIANAFVGGSFIVCFLINK